MKEATIGALGARISEYYNDALQKGHFPEA